MTRTVLVTYAARYGSTREVAEEIATVLRESGVTVEARPVKEVRTLGGYGPVILGAPLLMFHWHKDALAFLTRHRAALSERPLALFALGPVKNPRAEKEWRDASAQLDKSLANFSWLKPVTKEVFGGKFDPSVLSFPCNKLAGAAPASDARDWVAIRSWATNLTATLIS